MSQQINLLDPALLTRKDWFGLRMMLLAAGVILLLVVVFYIWLKQDVKQLKQRQQQLAIQVVSSKMELDNAINERVPKQPSATLQRQLIQAQQKLHTRQQVLLFLQQHSFAQQTVPSQYMEAFARRSMSDLWLTGFVVDDAHDYLEIQGRTVKAELVGSYLASLSAETVLKGRAFSSFETKSFEIDSAELLKSVSRQPSNQNKLRVNEFVIKSRVKIDQPVTSDRHEAAL